MMTTPQFVHDGTIIHDGTHLHNSAPFVLTSILPANASNLERNLEFTQIRSSHDPIVPSLWNADTCPSAFLPFLASAMSVEMWDARWSDAEQRAEIKGSFDLHRHKGTPYAIKQALSMRGHEDAELVERVDYRRHDGTLTHDGSARHGGPTDYKHHNGQITHNGKYRHDVVARWATYKVILKRAVTHTEATDIKSMLAIMSRNCCHLVSLDYSAAPLLHNGLARHDGQYNHGEIN